MPDISMCINKSCPSRMKCYRYRAVPNDHHQSVMNFDPKGKQKCSSFESIEGRRVREEKNVE